jgi:acylpyruvate hydrolase
MKIFCVGRNYADHAKELNNDIPTEPLIFMKPATALLLDDKPFYHPDFSINIHYELELVVKIKKNGRSIEPAFASTYYDELGLGIDFTARDLQDSLKSKGHPWELAKAFDHSAVLGGFISKDTFDMADIRFELHKNGNVVQQGHTANLIFSVDHLICYISRYFTLQQGDLIYTGTPAGVGKVSIGDQLLGILEGQQLIYCEVK